MRLLKRLSIGALGLAAVVMLTIMAPKAAKAISATMVQVVNTAPNPVYNQDVDSPGRQPLQETCYAGKPQGFTMVCEMPLPSANSEFVVQQVSVLVTGARPNSAAYIETKSSENSFPTGIYLPFVQVANGWVATAQVTMYAGSTGYPNCEAVYTPTTADGNSISCTMIGYSITTGYDERHFSAE